MITVTGRKRRRPPPEEPKEAPKEEQKDDKERGITGRCVSVGDRYEKIKKIGQGTYGVVYLARDRQTAAMYALKRCIPHHAESDGFPVTALREIQSLRLCQQHTNVVHLETVAVSASGVFLVFEYCRHDLADLIDAEYKRYHRSPFSPAAVKRLLHQLLSAVEFLHARRLIHRDIKMSNLLYTESDLKLADFGLSRPVADKMTMNVASLWYRAPELLFGAESYSIGMDLWAVGCVMAEFLMGTPLMAGRDEKDQIDKMVYCLGFPGEHCPWPKPRWPNIMIPRRALLDDFDWLSTEGLRLLTLLLEYDPAQRATAEQAVGSEYFAEDPLPLTADEMPKFG